MDSVEVYDHDPFEEEKCEYSVLIPQTQTSGEIENSEDDEEIILAEEPTQNPSSFTTWSQNETLALINVFSLYKDRFKGFKKKRVQWNLVSQELAKINIHKAPEKCEIKWKNLLRIYRLHKFENKPPGKFEFFNELDDIIANDPQFGYIVERHNNSMKNKSRKNSLNVEVGLSNGKRKKCSCLKSEKQKRHEDRIMLMTKKLLIEERKVKAFEDYLKFLKQNAENR